MNALAHPLSAPRAARSLTGAALVTLSASLLGSATAHAEEDARSAARRHFARGVELANAESYAEALAEFARAYELSPHHSVLYNIGQAHVAVGDAVAAVDALTRYLAEGRDQIPEQRKKAVSAEIERQRAMTAELEIETNVDGATISVGARLIGRTPLPASVRVAPGTHRIVASADDGRAVERTLRVEIGERHRLVLSLPPLAAQPASSSVVPRRSELSAPIERAPARPARESNQQATLGYVVGGAGIVLGGAALGHFFWNKARYDRWSSRDAELQRNPSFDAQQKNNELALGIERASIVTVCFAVGAGVALGTGTLLVLTADSRPAGPDSRSSYRMIEWRGAF